MSASMPERVALDVGGSEIALAVRRSPRARRITLRIDPVRAYAELIVPRRVGLAEALRFAEGKRAWIAQRLAALPEAVRFAEGTVIPVGGELLTIRNHAGRGPVRREGDALLVGGSPEHHGRRVRDWLKAHARTVLGQRSRELASRIGRRVTGIRLGDPKSRWGSCSPDGGLAYSWRLILAPPDVLDYVVAHEVAHLQELNHGRRFWRLVGELVPDVDGPRAWLRRNGTRLLRYG
jgi:predicted metal-dependent hydrolase